MNRLRLGLFAVAMTGALAMAGCVTSAPSLGGGGPIGSFSAPPLDSTAPSDEPSTPAGGPPSATPSPTPTPTASSVSCSWGRAGDPADPATGKPPTTVPSTGTATMSILTSQGSITIKLDRSVTPCTVASFVYLTDMQFFDETSCHRLTTSVVYLLQCGDPTGTGRGGPSYTIPDEALPLPGASAPPVNYPRGTVAMANAGTPNSGGSQFFMIYKDSMLPDSSTKFGVITSGVEILDEIAQGGVNATVGVTDGTPEFPLKILSVTITTP